MNKENNMDKVSKFFFRLNKGEHEDDPNNFICTIKNAVCPTNIEVFLEWLVSNSGPRSFTHCWEFTFILSDNCKIVVYSDSYSDDRGRNIASFDKYIGNIKKHHYVFIKGTSWDDDANAVSCIGDLVGFFEDDNIYNIMLNDKLNAQCTNFNWNKPRIIADKDIITKMSFNINMIFTTEELLLETLIELPSYIEDEKMKLDSYIIVCTNYKSTCISTNIDFICNSKQNKIIYSYELVFKCEKNE